MNENARSRTGVILVFLAAMLWATDAPFRYYLTGSLGAQFIVLAEHAVNFLLVIPFLVIGWREIRNLTLRQWLAIGIIGIGASALATILFTKSFVYVNPSVSILLQKLQPLIVISFASGFLGERMGKKFWVWAALALAGAYAISFPSLKPELYAGEAFNPNIIGASLAVGAAALWGTGTVLGRYLLNSVKFTTVTALRFAVAFLFLAIINFKPSVLQDFASLSPRDYLFIIIIAVTSGFTSLFIYYRGLSETKASVATVAELGFPFFAVVVNSAALHFYLKPLQIVGMALLLFAIWRLSGTSKKISHESVESRLPA